jgi:Flp pilus assembly secretin CpaC
LICHGRIWRTAALVSLCCVASLGAGPLGAQVTDTAVLRIDLPVGRSFPITTQSNITQVSVASPDVADVVVMGAHDVVINGHGPGESDVILWLADSPLRHYRVAVHSPADRQQIVLAIKFAEVRRDFLRTIGVSGLYRDAHNRIGTNQFNTDNAINSTTGVITLPTTIGFGTILSDFGTSKLLGLLNADEQTGTARILAEPTLMAGTMARSLAVSESSCALRPKKIKTYDGDTEARRKAKQISHECTRTRANLAVEEV